MAGASGRNEVVDPARPKRNATIPGRVMDELVIEALSGTDVPLSAYAIADRLREARRTGNAVAIYRSLDRLARKAVIERVESLSAYRLCTTSQAVLLACSRCGSTVPLPIPSNYQGIEQAVQEAGFALQKLVVEAVGVCTHCRHA